MPGAVDEQQGRTRFGNNRGALAKHGSPAFKVLVEVNEKGPFAGQPIFLPRPILVHFKALPRRVAVKPQTAGEPGGQTGLESGQL